MGYYAHLIRGQYELLSRREPIEKLIAQPDTDASLKERLAQALQARRFASRELGLPDNGSYTSYADLGRPYALWNIYAAEEFALAPYEWCYLFTGCLSYRGYFDADALQKEARKLREAGYDVYLAPVPAYSTLGWFDDPVLNTMLGPDPSVAGTVFHEMAHQQQFVKGDTAFNESFATFVEQEGLRIYLRDAPEQALAAKLRQQRHEQFVALMLAARERLQALYASGLPPGDMRLRKQQEFQRLRRDYAALKQQWGGDSRYDGWMSGELNNARLLPFGLYNEWVPAFETLFRDSGGNWRDFYLEVEALARVGPQERRQRLERLRARAG